jgi:hypothetical protein
MKMFIDKQGTVHAVYSDLLADLPLGEKKVVRASNVEFNEFTQDWEARLPFTGEIIASGKHRDEVIRQEVAVIESRLQQSLTQS